jgi:hypothetical protein
MTHRPVAEAAKSDAPRHGPPNPCQAMKSMPLRWGKRRGPLHLIVEGRAQSVVLIPAHPKAVEGTPLRLEALEEKFGKKTFFLLSTEHVLFCSSRARVKIERAICLEIYFFPLVEYMKVGLRVFY